MVGVAQPGVLRAGQPRVAALAQLAVFRAAHAIDTLVEMLGAVKAIEDDLRGSLGHLRPRRLHVWLPHVHRDRRDLLALDRGESQGPEGFPALPLAVVGHEEHAGALQIAHHGHEVVPPLEGLLVHAHVAQRHRAAALQAAGDRAALDAPHGVPAEAELARDRRHRRLAEPVDRQPLEQEGELRTRRGPRDGALQHAVGGALDAGHTRVEPRLQLAGVEVPPLAVPMIVDRAGALAFGAVRRRAIGAGQPDVHRPTRHIDVHPLHRPRGCEPQDRRVQLVVPHRPASSAPAGPRDDTNTRLSRVTLPTRNPEEPKKLSATKEETIMTDEQQEPWSS